MARCIFLFCLITLTGIVYAGKFSKLFTKEKGFKDNGAAIFLSVRPFSTTGCVTQCLNQDGCIAVVYHDGSQMCFLLNSVETLIETSDAGYSFIFIGDHCMNGWVAFAGSCYLFGNQAYSWSNALDFCKSEGATLVEIETESENVFIKDTLSTNNNPKHWIGLNDLDQEGSWVWTSGNVPSYIDWGQDQPNNGNVSNCGAMWESFDNMWVDEACGSLFYPICEQESTSDAIETYYIPI